jgi:hypothetical protein
VEAPLPGEGRVDIEQIHKVLVTAVRIANAGRPEAERSRVIYTDPRSAVLRCSGAFPRANSCSSFGLFFRDCQRSEPHKALTAVRSCPIRHSA